MSEQPTFEDKLQQLESIVSQLEKVIVPWKPLWLIFKPVLVWSKIYKRH